MLGPLSPEEQIHLTRIRGKRIVFTNGCFDILHRGHITYLTEARKLGDYLIIGLNSDASVQRLKGPDRPINSQSDRKYLLEALRAVDFVIIFNEDTPIELIRAIKPSVLVKGGDWPPDKIVGADIVSAYGGEVRSLPFIEGHSTTSLLEKSQGKK